MLLAANKLREKSRFTVSLSRNVTQEGGVEGGIPQPGHTTKEKHRKRQQILRSRISKVLKTISFFLLLSLFPKKTQVCFLWKYVCHDIKREISKTLSYMQLLPIHCNLENPLL